MHQAEYDERQARREEGKDTEASDVKSKYLEVSAVWEAVHGDRDDFELIVVGQQESEAASEARVVRPAL